MDDEAGKMKQQKRLKHSRYINGLNGLRALAVIGVILYHLIPFTVPGGYLGVVIFLVLTGYLITDLLIQEWDQEGHIYLLAFYKRRIRRLYPALVTMLFATASYITLFQRQLLAHLGGVLSSNLIYIYNWWSILHGESYFERFADTASPFTHLWTLSIEGQFYLIWPFVIIGMILLIKPRRRISWWLFGGAIVSALLMAILFVPGHDPSRVYYGTDTRAAAILIGASLAILWPSTKLKQKVERQQRIALDSVGALMVVLMLVGYLTLNAEHAFTYRGGMFLYSLVAALLIAVIVHPGSDWNRWLTNPLFDWIGSRSYGIYLYQFPVMIFYENQVKNLAAHPVLHGCAQMVLILLISELSYRLIERPFSHFEWQAGHGLWQDTRRSLKQLGQYRIYLVPVCVLIVIGTVGALSHPTTPDANKSQLARKIKQNEQANAAKKQSLVAAAKKANRQAAKGTSESTQNTKQKQTVKVPKLDPKLSAGITDQQLITAQSLNVTAIGDSVMLDGGDVLQQLFPKMVLDAKVGRQANQSLDILKTYAKQDALGQVVLIGLGTNGPFTNQQLDDMMKTIGSKRQVFWVNVHVPTRTWQNSVNQSLVAAQKRWHNLKVLDWNQACSGHADWFYSDQVHPNQDGKLYYANFIGKQMLEQINH
ncbi:acyltransferase [Loigolactobacillus bifermentans DSM 20003]|uniref:Acyltransferase n=2 Tax=Loigolactobacillus bifermentans TaxID=1607 RepID=A0A0R1GQL0_9LACO|nr:acyltransferase [Loigolactobacillus bifermentans DSM 20003]